MDIPWDDVRLFLAIAETGSLSAAARRLRLGQPTVTRRLAQLEYALGATLFRRSVEGAALTDEGARLLEPAKRMAEWASEVGRAAQGGGPQGVVRVTSSPFMAADLLAPFAARLAAEHPGLRLEVSSSVAYADLGRGEADLALRLRLPGASDLRVLRSARFPVRVFVSPALRDRLGPKPDVRDIPWIAWCAPFEAVPPNPQLAQLIPGFVPAFAADDYLVQLAAAEAGVGAMVLSPVRHRFSPERNLVALDLDLGPYSIAEVHLVGKPSALDIPRVRLVAGLLEELLIEFEATKRR